MIALWIGFLASFFASALLTLSLRRHRRKTRGGK
jgi:hypothetical protein